MLIIVSAFLLNFASATDYCTLCENGMHTMCKFKEGPADSCMNYTKITLSPSEKRYILDIHNDIRNHVASGQEARGALGNQPPAADMFLLDWDDELAEIAQRWVDQCTSVNATKQHDKCKKTDRFDVGQNIVTAVTTDGELPELSLLILNWYKQMVYVIPSDVDDFIGIWRGKYLIGQYTQLVWAKTKFVGCAVAAFKEAVEDSQYNVRFVCNYGPAGNIVGQPIYERGKPCSKCPHRVCDKSRSNLCLGGKKGMDIRKQKTVIYKKYKDKVTTLSNLIDTTDTKKNISKFLNLNTSDISENSVRVINTDDFNNSQNYDSTYTSGVGILNPTGTNSDDRSHDFTGYTSTSLLKTMRTVTLHRDNVDYTILTDVSNAVLISDENEENLQDVMFNTTFNNQEYLNSFIFRLTSSVKLLIDEIFNESIHSDVAGINFKADGKSIVDLTKDKCEKEVKLDKGTRLMQQCGDDWKNSRHSPRKFVRSSHRRQDEIIVRGNEVILPGNRHFRRAEGVWHLGHCRCAQFLVSGCESFIATYLFFVIYSFVHLFVI